LLTTPELAGYAYCPTCIHAAHHDDAIVNNYTVQRVGTSMTTSTAANLGSVAAELKKVIAESRSNLPSTVKIFLRGQTK